MNSESFLVWTWENRAIRNSRNFSKTFTSETSAGIPIQDLGSKRRDRRLTELVICVDGQGCNASICQRKFRLFAANIRYCRSWAKKSWRLGYNNKLYKCSALATAHVAVEECVLSAEIWKDALTYKPLAPDTEKAWLTPQVYRNDWLAAEIYPDSDDTESTSSMANGADGVADRVEFEYNRQGEVIAKRDQNGTVHTYEYDNLGRLLHDRITTLASGIDGAVRRISTVYDVVGNVKSVTSFDNATVGSGNVINQVVYEYDNNGLLSKEFSNPSGTVNVATTPHIGYTYDTTKSGDNFTKRLRPATMKYPRGKP